MKRKAAPAHSRRQPRTQELHSGHWELQLLGGLRACSGDVVLQHFPTRAVACLLARLALQPQRHHSREELAELLWPAPPHTAPWPPQTLRNRLRNALSSLRMLLEPPGHRAGPVLLAQARHVRLNADLFNTDVLRFEALCQAVGSAALAAQTAEAQAAAQAAAQSARALYRGELLPGYDDDWIRDKRLQLAGLYEGLSRALPLADQPPSQHPSAQGARLAHPGYAGAGAQRVAGPLSGHRLLAYVTPFFGRIHELQQLQDQLREHRLLQLVGPGGCGKTRLSVQWAQHDRSFDSIHLVALQECPSVDRVIDHVRATLGLQVTQAPAITQVVDRLQGRRALLILDSCEHLMPRAERALRRPAASASLAGTLGELQQRLPQLHLLLTSRRALHANSPRLTLQPLPLPAPDANPAQALQQAAVALFVDRARAVRADFTLHARNVESVVRLCRLLDGLPVLIEIAASRVRQYAPRELCDGLTADRADRADRAVLQRTGPAARRAGHHRSVQALLEWSWRQLPPSLQAMLGAVVTFRGGWTLPAAAAVAHCSLAACAQRLQALAEHHLVYCDMDHNGQARWQMLGVVRDQIQAWVPADTASAHRHRLLEHLLAWAQSLQARCAPFDRAETQNVETALASALADGDAATGVALALALQWPWVAVGVSAQVLQLLDTLAQQLQTPGPASPPPAPPVLAALHSLRARLLMHSGQGPAAVAAAERALACAGTDTAARADALQALASVRWRLLPDVAALLPLAEEACRLAHAAAAQGAPPMAARATLLRASMVITQGQHPQQAQQLFTQAQALFAAAGDEAGALSALPGLIVCLQAQGQHHSAIEQAQAGLLRAQALGHVETQLLLLNRLSNSHEALRRYRQVVRVNQQQLTLARQHGLAYHQAIAVWNLSLALVRLRQARTALLLMAYTAQWWGRSFGALSAEDQAQMQDLRTRAQRLLGPAACEQLWAEGAALSSQQGLDLADGV